MMKMRRIFSAVLAVALLAGLCACGGGGGGGTPSNTVAVSEPAIPDSVTSEPVAPDSTTPSLDDPESTDLEPNALEPTVEDDPYDVLKVDESYRDQWNFIYLVRDNNYYTLSRFITTEKATKYQVGWNQANGKNSVIIGIPNGDYFLSIGNIPVVTIEDGDMVIGEGKTTLGLTPATLVGYTIPIFADIDRSNYCIFCPSPQEIVQINIQGAKQFEMVDSQGNAVPQIVGYATGGNFYYRPDFTNLIEGETYTLSWFEGTTYHEYTVKADSPYYKIGNSMQDAVKVQKITIEGELHKEGYASFDLSDVPPGLYRTDIGGFICIPE